MFSGALTQPFIKRGIPSTLAYHLTYLSHPSHPLAFPFNGLSTIPLTPFLLRKGELMNLGDTPFD